MGKTFGKSPFGKMWVVTAAYEWADWMRSPSDESVGLLNE